MHQWKLFFMLPHIFSCLVDFAWFTLQAPFTLRDEIPFEICIYKHLSYAVATTSLAMPLFWRKKVPSQWWIKWFQGAPFVLVATIRQCFL